MLKTILRKVTTPTNKNYYYQVFSISEEAIIIFDETTNGLILCPIYDNRYFILHGQDVSIREVV